MGKKGDNRTTKGRVMYYDEGRPVKYSNRLMDKACRYYSLGMSKRLVSYLLDIEGDSFRYYLRQKQTKEIHEKDPNI